MNWTTSVTCCRCLHHFDRCHDGENAWGCAIFVRGGEARGHFGSKHDLTTFTAAGVPDGVICDDCADGLIAEGKMVTILERSGAPGFFEGMGLVNSPKTLES